MLILKDRRARWLLGGGLITLLAVLSAVVLWKMPKERQYLYFSFCVVALALILFWMGIENRRIGSRRLVLISVITALCCIGRFIPLFKPVTALTVLGAIYLGPTAGFLVGAMSALISNFYFGQGPWTPYQMLAWGLIGFCAGLLSVPLKRSRLLLLLYGFFSGVLFSAVMDLWTVLWQYGTITPALFGAATLTALPHTLLYAVSNLLFLLFLSKPFGEKLERVRIKYGL